MSTPRPGGRAADQLRAIEIIPDFTKWAEGSVLCCFGDTRVLCTASIEDRVPPWMKEQKPGQGWITAEYAMLPRSTDSRTRRESVAGAIGGRTHEISRLVGRAIRAAADLRAVGERTLTLDCDVLQADGGTRTAAITGAWVATRIATQRLMRLGKLSKDPIKRNVAAVSLGIVDGEVRLDLDYKEDQGADTDLNLVMTDALKIVEIQGTAEGAAFERAELDRMIDLGAKGIGELVAHQRAAAERARR